jgi:hypothetical protein
MRDTTFAFVTIGILIAGPSHGACTKPNTPACAIQNNAFPSPADFDQCRMQMIAYKGGMETYAACLKEAAQSPEEQSARDELENTLSQFNRRARGE